MCEDEFENAASLDELVKEYEEENDVVARTDDGNVTGCIAYTSEFTKWFATKYLNLLQEARRWGYKG